MTANFYVYEHWRPDTNQCFYVGKGRGGRAHRDNGRSSYWYNVVSKLKRAGLSWEVRVIATGLMEQQAFSLEVERITHWRALGVRIVNMTDGGEGSSNPSPEVRAKISAAHIGKKPWNFGRVTPAEVRVKIGERARNSSPETRAKLAASRVGKVVSEETRAKLSAAGAGRRHSMETRAKMSAALTGRAVSEEARAKLAASRRGKTTPPETRAKLSAAGVGRRHSLEARAKMSAACKGRTPPNKGKTVTVDCVLRLIGATND